jgi:NAD(P)-dependent dehydrogenase (short-subunit alcohol dehydrogenase family)
VVGEIAAAGGVAMSSVADARNIDDLRAAVAAAVARFGRIDVLVNNAGTMPLAFLSDHAEALQAWNDCIDINFRA